LGVRAFVSIDVEDPGLVSRVGLLKGAIASTGADVKLVEDENLHLTLAFLGELPESSVALVSEALRGVSHAPFRLHLKGVGCFPSCSRPRVVWVGAAEGGEEVEALHRKVASALRRAGFSLEEEGGFEPHLTVARVRSGRGVERLKKLIEGYADEDFGWLEVREFRLKKSTLTPRGPIYETLASFALVG